MPYEKIRFFTVLNWISTLGYTLSIMRMTFVVCCQEISWVIRIIPAKIYFSCDNLKRYDLIGWMSCAKKKKDFSPWFWTWILKTSFKWNERYGVVAGVVLSIQTFFKNFNCFVLIWNLQKHAPWRDLKYAARKFNSSLISHPDCVVQPRKFSLNIRKLWGDRVKYSESLSKNFNHPA